MVRNASVKYEERGVSHVRQDKVDYLLDKLEIPLEKIPALLLGEKKKLNDLKFELDAVESLKRMGRMPKLTCFRFNQTRNRIKQAETARLITKGITSCQEMDGDETANRSCLVGPSLNSHLDGWYYIKYCVTDSSTLLPQGLFSARV